LYFFIYRSSSSIPSEETTIRSQYWNEALFSVAIDYLYPKMLIEIKQRIESICYTNIHHHQQRIITDEQVIILQGIYKYFIYLTRLSSTISKVTINSNNYWLLLQQHPFYVLNNIGYKTLKEIILPMKNFNNKNVTLFLLSIIPLITCPLQVTNDLLYITTQQQSS